MKIKEELELIKRGTEKNEKWLETYKKLIDPKTKPYELFLSQKAA